MSDVFWDNLRYFSKVSKVDQWGDPDAINKDLILRLDNFRHFIGFPIYVTSGVRNQDSSKGSYHHPEKGACAVDIVIPGYNKTPFDLVIDATRFNFTGIGLYLHWKFQGKVTGGLHLDMRPFDRGARWMGVLDQNRKQHYVTLNFINLMKQWEKYKEVDQIIN